MMNLFGCSAVKFEKYSSSDPGINVSMDYVSGWKYDETRGAYNSYAQLLFFPEGGRRRSRALIDLTVKASSRPDGSILTAESAEKDLLEKRMQFKDAKILSRSKPKILGEEASAIEMSYLAMEDLRSYKSKLIPIKEKIIILKKGDKIYFLRYENSAKEFNRYKSAFTHIAQSMKLKEQ